MTNCTGRLGFEAFTGFFLSDFSDASESAPSGPSIHRLGDHLQSHPAIHALLSVDVSTRLDYPTHRRGRDSESAVPASTWSSPGIWLRWDLSRSIFQTARIAETLDWPQPELLTRAGSRHRCRRTLGAILKYREDIERVPGRGGDTDPSEVFARWVLRSSYLSRRSSTLPGSTTPPSHRVRQSGDDD